MGRTVDLKYGTFTFDDRGEDYPLGEWDMGELGVESAVNPFWAKEHPIDAFWLAMNSFLLPVDAGLSSAISFGSYDYNVYKFIV